MTDRSNYGPVRRLSPSMSIDHRKPYSRTGLKGVLGTLDLNSGDAAVPTPSDSPYYPFHVETPQLEAPTQNRTSAPDGPRDIPGFPTYEQYQRIEGEYLSSLSERKQPKALISQALFDKVLAVLHNGAEERGSTAQFRFWVRKMFTLAYPQTSFNHNAGRTPEVVVLHDKRPVAIKEQIYEVLCYCHAVARHGGRDKTCATLRINYSWVPKELTAKFVKACPTCTLKRSGNPDLLSQFGQTVSSSSSSSSSPLYAQPLTVTVPLEPTSLPVFPGGPNDSSPPPPPPPPPGLSFVVGSEGCDDGCGCGGGSGSTGSCFGHHSIFATPDLSVYPSPTLSAGSLGPATPSPFLPGGLFGYPAVFDPGHGSLSSVAGWDTSSLSPCGLMYPEEMHAAISEQHHEASGGGAEEISCSTQGDMQLQLPSTQKVTHHHPLCARAHNGDCDNNGGGDHDDDGGVGAECRCGADPDPCSTAAEMMNDIDPVLLMERGGGGYSPFALVGPTATRTATDDHDAEADIDPGTVTGGPVGLGGDDGPYHRHPYLNCNLAAESSSPLNSSGGRVFQQYQHQHQHQHQRQHHYQRHHHPHARPSQQQQQQQFGLALGTTAPALGEREPASISRLGPRQRQRQHQRQRRLQLSPLTHDDDASSGTATTTVTATDGRSGSGSFSMPRDDNPLLNMLMFKFAPPPPPHGTQDGPRPGVRVVASPTPIAMRSAAASMGMGGIEVGENILFVLWGRDNLPGTTMIDDRRGA